jgi:hypothetical protein
MGSASTGDVNAARDEVIAAIEECCQSLFDFYDEVSMQLDVGLTAIGAAMTACCTQEIAYLSAPNTATAPAVPGPPDAMGNPTVAAPAKTVTSTNGGIAAAAIAHQCQTQVYQAQLYQAQTSAYLAAQQAWQEAQIVPSLIALVGQLVALTKMYDQWTLYLEKTNQIMCGLADTAFPEALACWQTAKADYTECLAEQNANYAGDLAQYRARLTWGCDQADKLRDHVCLDGTGEGGFLTADAQHVQNMAQNAANIATDGQWAVQEAKPYIVDLIAELEGNHAPWLNEEFGAITGQLAGLYGKAQGICAYLNDCGQALVDNYVGGELASTREMLDAGVQNAIDCLGQIQDAITQAGECMEDQKALYDAHRPGMETFGPEVLAQTNALLSNGELMTECWQDANECGQTFKDRYELQFAVDQDALAAKIMQLACDMAQNHMAVYECQKGLSEQCAAHWEDHYEACDAAIAEGITAEAKLLLNTRRATFDTFIERHEKLWANFCDHYWPLEMEYSSTLLTKATEQICEWNDSLEKVCEEACEFLDWWKDTYQTEEQITSPKIIAAGVDACEQQIDTYTRLDDLLDRLCDKWFDEICQCDLDDIQALCTLHDKKDVVCEITDNADCIETIADRLKACWLDDGLPCEKDYLQELCDLSKYNPKFCELEDRAVMHVRRRFDAARESLLRSTQRYCVGDIEDALCKLESEQATAEAQAIELANRHEQWWETQECNRRHTYKMNMIETYQSFAALSIQGFDTADQQYDRLLTQLHNRLSRSYTYLSQANQAGATAASSTAQGVSQALDTTRIGQFYPQLFQQLKSDYSQASQAMVLRGQEQTRIGHQHMSSALQALNSADALADSATSQAQTTVQHGFRYKQQALAAANSAGDTATSIQSLALQHIDDGQQLADNAIRWKSQEWQVVCDSIQKSQNQMQIAQSVMAQAMAFEQHRDQLLQNCVDTGLNAERQRFAIYQAGTQKVETAMRTAEAALTSSMNMYQTIWGQRMNAFAHLNGMGQWVAQGASAQNQTLGRGLGWMQVAAQLHQQGMQDKRGQIDQVCASLQQREAMMCQCLLGFNAVAGQTAQLANSFGGGVANSFDGVIGSVQSLLGQVPTIAQQPPQPNFSTSAPVSTTSIPTFPGSGSGSSIYTGV